LLAKIKMLETIAKTTQQSENTGDNGEYVTWRNRKVKIPRIGYNAGGQLTDYTPKKILSTLAFYYRHIIDRNLIEALTEEKEERHHKSLLDTAITAAVTENVCTLRDLDPLLRNRR
jgi:hypothetical protein